RRETVVVLGGFRYFPRHIHAPGALLGSPEMLGLSTSRLIHWLRQSPRPVDDIMIGRPKLVLASGSPRRVSLVNQAGIEPDALRPANIDETPRRGELPRACANRLARAKAQAALQLIRDDEELGGAYVLAADTVVAVGRRILPKAEL